MLTSWQYKGAINDILGSEASATVKPPADMQFNGSSSIGASTFALSPSAVSAYESSSYAAVQAALASKTARALLIPCTPNGPTDAACFDTVLNRVGSKAFRHTLTAAELTTWKKVAQSAATSYSSFDRGVEFAVAGMLQSPQFLYVTEQGEVDPQRPNMLRYTSVEMASRLSFFLLGTTPPDSLLTAAKNNQLSTADGVRTQARALLELPQAQTAVVPLFKEWLAFDGLAQSGKDRTAFPTFTDALANSMTEETSRFLTAVAFDSKRDFRDILDANFTYVDKTLAAHYGLPVPTAAGFSKVDLPANGPRAGVLSQAAFLTGHAHPIETSPTLRGKAVREKLLCESVPEPPPEVSTVLEEPPNSTPRPLRQRLQEHMTNPSCRSCHEITDPIGFGFQNFDAIGRYRTTEVNQTVDASGTLDDLGAFTNARGLVTLLKSDPRFTSCVTRTAFRAAAGHLETDGEEASMISIDTLARSQGFNFKTLLIELVASDAFRYGAKR